jgi:hypothetical protein
MRTDIFLRKQRMTRLNVNRRLIIEIIIINARIFMQNIVECAHNYTHEKILHNMLKISLKIGILFHMNYYNYYLQITK